MITSIMLFLAMFSVCHGFVLITTLYNEKDPVRLEEYTECLSKNLHNPYIEKIVVLFEDASNLPEEKKQLKKTLTHSEVDKVQLYYIQSRPSFQDIIDVANKFCGSNIIFANADIYFDESLKSFTQHPLDNFLVCLSRYDLIDDRWQSAANGFTIGKTRYKASFDSWIFKSPLNIKIPHQFKPGIWGCEKFANYAIKAGYRLINPSNEIKSYHVHGSFIRNYESIDIFNQLPFVYLPETNIKDVKPPLALEKEISGQFESLKALEKAARKRSPKNMK